MEAAMLELMETTEFEKITVKKICETAKVNRSTFYAHFTDIYEMVEKMEKRLSRELLESYPESCEPAEMWFSEDLIILFLKHIRKHRYFFRIALKTRRDFPLKQSFNAMWSQVVKPRCQKNGIMSEEEMMYYFVYFQAGFTMALKRWVDTGCGETEEEMAQTLLNCLPKIWQT